VRRHKDRVQNHDRAPLKHLDATASDHADAAAGPGTLA